jgi:hypothetical protein
MLRPSIDAALQRLDRAETLFGPLAIVGITELSPCWRPLLYALAERVHVRWNPVLGLAEQAPA